MKYTICCKKNLTNNLKISIWNIGICLIIFRSSESYIYMIIECCSMELLWNICTQIEMKSLNYFKKWNQINWLMNHYFFQISIRLISLKYLKTIHQTKVSVIIIKHLLKPVLFSDLLFQFPPSHCVFGTINVLLLVGKLVHTTWQIEFS